MKAEQVTKAQQQVLDAMRAYPALTDAFAAMIAVVESAALDDKNATALTNASAALPAPRIIAPATGVRADLPDPREGFAPHRAYHFTVAVSKGTVLHELKTLLGELAASRLATDWGHRCDLNQKLPETQVALFLDSNNKARHLGFADRGDKTTQKEDFQATGHQFAGDLAATLLCARIVKKVLDGERLSEGEQHLYQKLGHGFLRSCSGALALRHTGLREKGFAADRGSDRWALGSPLSPKKKGSSTELVGAFCQSYAGARLPLPPS